jgi:glycosyltransferase involved in cell wall biosynthesis
MVRRSLREADLVTTDGPALLAELVRSFPSCAGKAESILWGIELEQYLTLPERRSEAREDLLIPQDAVVITNARGLRIHDRPEISLPALERVLASRENVHVNVLTLGHQPEDAITGVLARLRAHPRCRVFDRFLNKEAVRDIWAASDLVVSVPLFDGISETLLEAMAAGCIPVLSNIPPNRIIVPDPENAIFTRADAPATVADDILRGLDRMDELRESAVPANQAWVRENASIDRAADRLAGLLRGLVEKETE